MSNALKIEQDLPYNFHRGEQVHWIRNGNRQVVTYIEKLKTRSSKVVNAQGFLMVVFDFELEHIDPCE
jgi:hypothetical protein